MVSVKHTAITIDESDEVIFSALLILPLGDAPSWLAAVQQIIRPDAEAATVEQARVMLESEIPDAVIAVEPSHTLLALFHALGQMSENTPLRAIITDAFDDPALYGVADVVLPPLPLYIHHQLHHALKNHTRRSTTTSEITALRQDKAVLESQIAAQKKTGDEVALLKTAIVHNVSHELRTPLLQVKSAVALLAEDATNPKLAGYALDATARLEDVVKNITQLANSVDEMNISVLLVRECVDYAVRNLRRAWRHKDDIERVKVLIPSQLPPALGDKQAISTALQLLIDNALKFSDSRTDVEVMAQHIDDCIQISIKDYGIGIPQDKFQNIFQTFYQVDSTSTRRYGGMGVGLSIVQLILERHNVKIEVESAVNQGSTFTFSLPVASMDNHC